MDPDEGNLPDEPDHPVVDDSPPATPQVIPSSADAQPANPEDALAADEASFNPLGEPSPVRPSQIDPGWREPLPDSMPQMVVRQLWEKWFGDRLPEQPAWGGMPNIELVYRAMGLSPDEMVAPDVVNTKFTEATREVANCLSELDRAGLLNRDNNDVMIRLILNKMEAARQILLGTCMLCRADTMQPSDLPPSDYGLWRFIPPGTESGKATPGQRLRMFAINDCMLRRFHRFQDSFMVRVVTQDGLATCAWRVAMKIDDYVRSLTNIRLTNPQVWWDMISGTGLNVIDGLTKYLKFSDDPEIPWLKPDRHVFSFANGVYLAMEERFIEYANIHRFFANSALPVAATHFDKVFDPNWLRVPDPMDIPTPNTDTIWHTQEIKKDVIRWIYALLGRLLYDVGEFDDWQIMLFFKGLANTGKSTIVNIVRLFYPHGMVGTIGNTIEKQFGLSRLYNMLMCIADDVRENWQIDQSDWQCMVSGGSFTAAVKHKDALDVEHWKAPVVATGNMVPGFHDNAGSASRRFAVVPLWKMVAHPDGSMSQKIEAEIPAILAKINRQYRNMIRRYGTRGIWELLPRDFKEERNQLAATSNALIGFLSSALVCKRDDLYMPLTVLCRQVMAYAHDKNLMIPRWGPDYYRGPLIRENIRVGIRIERKKYPRHTSCRPGPDFFVYGMDLAENCTEFTYPDLASPGGGDGDPLPPMSPSMDAPAPADLPPLDPPRRPLPQPSHVRPAPPGRTSLPSNPAKRARPAPS